MILKKFFEKFTPSSTTSSSSSSSSSSNSPRPPTTTVTTNRSHSMTAGDTNRSHRSTGFTSSDGQLSSASTSTLTSSRSTSSPMTNRPQQTTTSTTMPATTTVSRNAVQFRNEDENYQTYKVKSISRPETTSDFEHLHLQHNQNIHLLYKNPNHSNKIVNQLDQMRKEHELCDVILVVDSKQIYCHKVILATNSPYFLAMFSAGLLETKSNRVELKEIDVDSLELLVDYMYTGELPITESNVQLLLITANLLGMTNIKDSCAQFIQSQIDINNCLEIRHFSDLHSCLVLQRHADAFIDQYFSEIVQKDEFLSLDVDQLIELIKRDHLAVSSEHIVYSSVLKWIDHNYDNRIGFLARLMQHVRFGVLKHDELARIAATPMMKRNILCMELIAEALHYKAIKMNESEFKSCQSEFNKTRITPRIPLGLPKIMYIFGGQAPKAVSKVEVYDFRSQQWKFHDDMPSKRCRAGDGFVYLMGGFNGQSRVRTVDIYNAQTREWSTGPEMLCRRGTLGVGLLNDTIYAVGGFDGLSGLNSVECWNIKASSAWTMCASMTTRRSSVGIAVLRQHMYVVGGYCGLTRECLNSVEKYDPVANVWSMVASMKVRRSGASVNVYEDRIYVVGGHDGPQVLKAVEFYDSTTNNWSLIADLNVARRNAGFVIHNGLFYIIGGDDGHENLSSVEIFNPQHGMWSLLPDFLNEPKSYMSIIVIEDYH